MPSEPNAAIPQPCDTRGDVGVGWLKADRLLVLDFEGQISTLNDEWKRPQRHIPDRPADFWRCPFAADGEHALFVKPTKQTKALNIYRLEIDAWDRTTQLTNGKFDQSPDARPTASSFIYTTMVNGKKLLMRMSHGGRPTQAIVGGSVEVGRDFSGRPANCHAYRIGGAGVQTHLVIKVIPANGGAPIKIRGTQSP